ncbi:MAG TPA: signal peptidase I [Blastocatellia bacterium]|jgi:signal peptidase I|nr:signal peptidase I [Blastocatellia bacterium]
MSKKAKALIIVAAALFLALAGMGIYFRIYYRLVIVTTGSMANTIIPGDRVLCGWNVGEVKRGDIVVFKLPTDPKVMYMHRVIGLPGETIQVKGGRVFIDGGELPEERALVRLTGLEEPQSPVVKVEPKPQGASYRVFYDVDRYSGGDDSEINPGLKYGAAEPYKISSGNYFVLGDSRDNCMDSRYWGTVPRDLIVSKAIMIFDSSAKGAEGRLFKPLK